MFELMKQMKVGTVLSVLAATLPYCQTKVNFTEFQKHDFCFVFTSAKEVMFSSALVSLFKQDCTKTTQPILTKFGGKVAYGPLKKPLDFGGNPDSISCYVRVRIGLCLWLGGYE